MKRNLFYAAFVVLLLGNSCNKNSDAPLKAIATQNKVSGKQGSLAVLKMDENIAKELAVVDATAAALAFATLGKVPVAGSYLALWAGFAASRQAEPTIRKTYEQKLVGPDDQQPDGLTKGYLGIAHNDLMVKAAAKNIPVVVADHKFNAALKELLLENAYFGAYDQLGDLYDAYEVSLAGIVAYTAQYVQGSSVDINGMIQDQAAFSPGVKASLMDICSSMNKLDGQDMLAYLVHTESAVKASAALNTEEKECICCFTGVLYSSLSLWQSN